MNAPGRRPALPSLRLQLRKQDNVADAFLSPQHHAQAVDADAARRGQAVFEGDEEILAELSQQRFEPGLLEMLVTSQCFLKLRLRHHHE